MSSISFMQNFELHKNFLQYRIYLNSAVTCHHNNVKSFSPTHIYVVNEGFKAEIDVTMDVTMSAISDFKPITFFHSKATYIHTY